MLLAFIRRLKNDVYFRIRVFLRISFIFNFAYSLFLCVIGWLYSSKWFFVTAIYYGLLSLVRIFVFLQIKAPKKLCSKIKAMRICGYFLLVINLVVSTMTFILVNGYHNVKYHEITVITIATYTFSALTVAIVNSVKYLKKNDHLHFCVKMISLISASVSLVTLTNTMLATFGEEEILLRSIVMPLLSGAVAIFIIVSAILIIYKANIQLKGLENGKEGQ